MIIKVNGSDLYYQKLGQGHPLILLHGHHLDGGMYSKVIAPLSLYYTVYALDMRGHGLSGGEIAEHYQTEVEDLSAFIKALDLKQPYVFGYDSGGLVTLLLASQDSSLLGKSIVAGVFIDGKGIHKYHYLTEGVRRFLKFDRDSRVELTESYMEPDSLKKITIPVLCAVGENDWVKVEHVRWYSSLIPQGRLAIMPRQSHDSYVVDSLKILDLIKDFCKES
ncbi:MAG: alpha/beta hydrolase [Lactobacillus equicursoris]|uniref:alpha/beta fold hydrolase n=1 Tax=Lactobacillus equicursoris TaxID=420645 RepID=UPI0024320671|nr:alpha/beta hydrolase [Lactobacillus equicursoris]MDD6406586.1 alpha/beta hydrolase [Lactobacillus equicursoris]